MFIYSYVNRLKKEKKKNIFVRLEYYLQLCFDNDTSNNPFSYDNIS